MYVQRASQIARAPTHPTQWARAWTRCYASAHAGEGIGDGDDGVQWFQRLRTEMLGRDTITSREILSSTTSSKLIDTLESFLPAEWCPRPHPLRPHLDIGHHLIYFNPSVPADKLLPDGTDPLQDPGAPWVRRMWAGGSLRLRPEVYYDKANAFKLNSPAICAERIQDVQLRGQGDSAKIFVTIERRFAKPSTVLATHGKATGRKLSQKALFKFAEQQHDGEEWGDAVFKEVRNLVFLKERTTTELEVIKAGEMAPVRYLTAPTQPDFSHALTPTRSLLFRFSALTWNAHLIHLDPHYARTVEGHRNMLVHGPLSLTILLQAITNHIEKHTSGKQCFESIEYRNLAPLYCDEEMHVCGKVTKTSDNGNQYDVWIEGPTGGMAVKGTVNAAVKPSQVRMHEAIQRKTTQHNQDGKVGKSTSIHSAPQTTSDHDSSSEAGLKAVESPLILKPFVLPQESPVNQSNPSPELPDQSLQTNPTDQDTCANTESTTESQQQPIPTRRVEAPPSPMKPTMSLRTRSILHRLGSYASGISSIAPVPETSPIEPLPIPIHTYAAEPYKPPIRLIKVPLARITRISSTMDTTQERKPVVAIQWKEGRRRKSAIVGTSKR